jgi:hypothetical protein
MHLAQADNTAFRNGLVYTGYIETSLGHHARQPAGDQW